MASPQIRFKGFAAPWGERKLKELASRVTQKNTSMKVTETFTNSAELGIVSQLDYFDHDVAKEGSISGYLVVQPEDFVYNPRISTSAPVGPIKRNRLGRPGVMSPLYMVFRPGDDISNAYLERYFETSGWHDFMRVNGNSGARSDRFSISDLVFFEMPIPCPDKDEQTAIAATFEEFDDLIDLRQGELDKLKSFKQAMLQKMFPKKGCTVPEIRFKGFVDPWERCILDDLCEVGSGRDYKHLGEGDVPVYGTGGYMLSVNEALSYTDDAVGIGRKGTIDKPYILEAPFWTIDTLFYCIPSKGVDLRFLHGLFLNVDWASKDESTGVPSLSKEAINSVEAMAPELPEQQLIGAFFASLDNLIDLHQQELGKLKSFKQAMLQKMFV